MGRAKTTAKNTKEEKPTSSTTTINASAKRSRRPDPFSTLATHLLGNILSHLDLRDHVRLGAVCRTFHEYAMLEDPPVSKSIVHVSTGDPRSLLQRYLWMDRAREWKHVNCVGHFHGWLVTLEEDHGLCLSHRILGLRITLPSLVRWNVQKVVLSAEPTSDECVAAAWYYVWDGEYHQDFIAICQPRGGKAWVNVDDFPKDPFDEGEVLPPSITDLAFHAGRLWASLDDDGLHVAAWEIDYVDALPLLKRSPASLLLPYSSSHSFLVQLSCGTLMVAVRGDDDRCFQLWECGAAGWVERTNLEGGALVLRENRLDGYVPCVYLTAEEVKGASTLRGEGVYLDVGGFATYVYRYHRKIGKFALAERAPYLTDQTRSLMAEMQLQLEEARHFALHPAWLGNDEKAPSP